MRSFSGTLAVLLVLTAACSGGSSGTSSQTAPSAIDPDEFGFGVESLPPFPSQSVLEDYVADVAAQRASNVGGSSSGSNDASGASAAPSAEGGSGGSGGASAKSENITNNQEQNVDEGGIVKNIGDHLVVLRKGRLYAVSVAERGKLAQTGTIAVASTPALNEGVWYDEMLVNGNLVYVIGYRYGVTSTGGEADTWAFGTTEVSSFRLVHGAFERLKTLYIESSDYFSGTNYASRMLEGKLVFYMPYAVSRGWGEARPKVRFPRYFEANPDGTFTPKEPIFGATDVLRPVEAPKNYGVFQTIMKCDLPDDGSFGCSARAVLTSYSREHYVTGTAVYLATPPHVYAFRFKDFGALAHQLNVTPLNQFSFKAHKGVLHIVGQSWEKPRASGEAVGEGYRPPTRSVRVTSIPLSRFDVRGENGPSSVDLVTEGPQESSYMNENRFVGPTLYASVVRYGTTAQQGIPSVLIAHDAETKKTARLDWPGRVTRIEPLGDRALVATQAGDPYGYGTSTMNLALETIRLSGDTVDPLGKLDLPGMAEGESRSHAFFYKPEAHAFGLPVLSPEGGRGGSYWYGSGISNIAFVDVSASGALAPLGALASSNVAGTCEVSCVDWYGNTRPIFLRDRVFGLMGSELREIALRPGVNPTSAPLELTRD